mgnify:CR=1 FL=1
MNFTEAMFAYSAQDLILEPFAGIVFGMSPGASTRLAGLQNGGVLLGMVQAATSINEATLSFVPKLVVIAVILALFGGSILYLIADFTVEIYSRIPDLLL